MKESNAPQKEPGIGFANVGFILSCLSAFYTATLLFSILLNSLSMSMTTLPEEMIRDIRFFQLSAFAGIFVTALTAVILSYVSHKKGCKNERKKLAVIISSISFAISIILIIIFLI